MIIAPTTCEAVPWVLVFVISGPVLALIAYFLAPIVVRCLLEQNNCCVVRSRVTPVSTTVEEKSDHIANLKDLFITLPSCIGRLLALGIIFSDVYALFPPEQSASVVQATSTCDADARSSNGLGEFLARCQQDPLPPWFPIVQAVAEVSRRILLIWFLYVVWNFTVQLLELVFAKLEASAEKTRSKVDDMVVPLFGEAVKRIWTLFFVVQTMANLDIDMTTIIASVSVMSVAIAFAAQDWIRTFFGVLVLIMNKPFEVGEAVSINGTAGIVDDITLRYLILKKFTGDQQIIPNGTFLSAEVNNISRRDKISLNLKWEIGHEVTTSAKFAEEEMNTMNGKIKMLRADLKAAIDADADLSGQYREVRLSLVPDGVRVDLECSYPHPESWAGFCDKEADMVLTVRSLMARHALHFAAPIVELARPKTTE